jgi:hypothetical protein
VGTKEYLRAHLQAQRDARKAGRLAAKSGLWVAKKVKTGTCPICGKHPRNPSEHTKSHKKSHSKGFGPDGIAIGRRRAPGAAFAGKRHH